MIIEHPDSWAKSLVDEGRENTARRRVRELVPFADTCKTRPPIFQRQVLSRVVPVAFLFRKTHIPGSTRGLHMNLFHREHQATHHTRNRRFSRAVSKMGGKPSASAPPAGEQWWLLTKGVPKGVPKKSHQAPGVKCSTERNRPSQGCLFCTQTRCLPMFCLSLVHEMNS